MRRFEYLDDGSRHRLKHNAAKKLMVLGCEGRLRAANGSRAWLRNPHRFNRPSLGILEPREGTNTAHFTGHFSRSAGAFTAATVVDFTAEDSANVRNQSSLGLPCVFLCDRSANKCASRFRAVYNFFFSRFARSPRAPTIPGATTASTVLIKPWPKTRWWHSNERRDD